MFSRFQLIALLAAILTLPAQNVLAQQVPQRAGPTLLLDTDRECQVTIDGKPVGTITPAKPGSFSITIGEHIVKAFIKDNPDVQQREVVNVVANKQYAVALSLRGAPQGKSQITGETDRSVKESTTGLEVPTTGRYLGAAVAPNSSDVVGALKRNLVNNVAQFALTLMGKEGNYVKAILQIMASGREEDTLEDGSRYFVDVNRYYSEYQMFLSPSAANAKVLESHTCTKSMAYEVNKYAPGGESSPLHFTSNDGTEDCSKVPLSFTVADQTQVSLKSVKVKIYESAHDFNDVALKETVQ
jgi:hypothetical protein